MDSLAAAAVAMAAAEEENYAHCQTTAITSADAPDCSLNGRPSHERGANDRTGMPAKRCTPKEEAAAATFAAGALLEAAAALQPAEKKNVPAESSFTTQVTDEDAAANECAGIGDDSDLDSVKTQSCPRTPSSIVEQ